MTLLTRVFCVLTTILGCPEVLIGQSTDESGEMAFFEIDDNSDENTFFDITSDQEDFNEKESSYSINGSLRQDIIYGIASPSEFFLRNRRGIEQINSELFLQAQGRPSDNVKIKVSGVVNYNWGSWSSDGYTLGGYELTPKLKDFFVDLTTDNGVWVRLGNQIIARGELESVKITDIVSKDSPKRTKSDEVKKDSKTKISKEKVQPKE